MLLKILLLFTLVPLVELALLFEVGRRIGTLPTILLILVTGFVGAVLATRLVAMKRAPRHSRQVFSSPRLCP